MAQGICSVEGCEKPRHRREWCVAHYTRWVRYRDVTAEHRRRSHPVEDGFWAKVDKDGPIPDYAPHLGPCWIWTAGRNWAGYGVWWGPDGGRLAHRVAYRMLVGPTPKGLDLDHLCRVRSCVNPSHVELVTHIVNMRRGDLSRNGEHLRSRTHCPQGHPYAGDNLWFSPSGSRRCRECNRQKRAAYVAANRDAVNARRRERRAAA